MAFEMEIADGADIVGREVDARHDVITMGFDAAGTPVECVHAHGATLMIYEVDDEPPIAVFGLKIGPMGVCQTLAPPELRSLAAQMLQIANELDGGRGRQ